MDLINKGLFAFAAYNAGPHRVDRWLVMNGDPRSGEVNAVDWIERIPFSETRNYVQRVLESLSVYRSDKGHSQAGAVWQAAQPAS